MTVSKVTSSKTKVTKAGIKKAAAQTSLEAAAEAKLLADADVSAPAGASVALGAAAGAAEGSGGSSTMLIVGGLLAAGGIAAAAAGGGEDTTTVLPVPAPPPPAPAPTYAVSAVNPSTNAAVTSVDEGSTVRFNIEVKNATQPNQSYTITGISADDLVDPSKLSGSVTIGSDGKGVVEIALKADLTTEAVAEKLKITVGTASAEVTVNDTSKTPPPASQTFTLTTSVDVSGTIKGDLSTTSTDGPDIFVAKGGESASATLTAADSLDGGAGADTMKLTTTGSDVVGAGAQVKGIETLNVTSTGAAATVNASGFSGVETIGNLGSTVALTVNGLTSIPKLSLVGTSANTTLEFASAAVTSASDKLTVSVNNAATTANADVTANEIEAVKVETTGSASGSAAADTAVRFTGNKLAALEVTGSTAANVAVGLTGASASNTGTVTSDAGAHNIRIGNVDATEKLSVDLGAGNDSLRISSISSLHTLVGGEGTDTLETEVTINNNNQINANISGFEAVTTKGAITVALDTTKNTVSTLTVSDGSAVTLTGLNGTGATVNLLATGGSATVTNATGWTGTSDSLTVNAGRSTTAGNFTGTVSANGVETITVVNNALVSDASTRTLSISSDTLKTLTVTGSQATVLTGGSTTLTKVDASGVAGAVTVSSLTRASAGSEVIGGAGNDSFTGGTGADTLTGNAGNDTLDGDAGNDVLSGGAGNDQFTGGTGADKMTGGEGADTFSIAANTALESYSTASASDVITDFTSGTDKLDVGAVAFLGNFANIQAALAANNAAGVADKSAAYITGENNLYVFSTKGNTLSVFDTVVKLEGVTELKAADVLVGAQGTGNTITATAGTLAAPKVAKISTTESNAVDGIKTTALDDTITAAAYSVVGTGAFITGGLGNDTLNMTVATQAGLDNLIAAGSAGVAVSGVETIRITVTEAASALSLTNKLPTDMRSLTVGGSGNLGTGLTATTTADNQSITVNSTVLAANLGLASTITVADKANNSVTTGSGNDTITVNGGNNTTGLTVAAGAGDDIVVLKDETALTGNANVLGGGGNASATSAGDTLQFDYAVGATLNLKALADAGTISGFEIVDLAANQGAAVALTLATGVTGVTLGGGATASTLDTTLTINATAAQATAVKTITTGEAEEVVELVISDAGSVNLANTATVTKTLTGLDAVKWGAEAVSLTLHNGAVAVTQAGGTAAQSVTFGTLAAAQSANIGSTGTVTFNVVGTNYAANIATNALTITADPGATSTLNFTGGAATIDLLAANLVETGIDTFSVGSMTGAATIIAGTTTTTVATGIIDLTETGATQLAHTISVDSIGDQSASITVQGFDAGTGGDVLNLQGADAVTANVVATTGAQIANAATVGAANQMIVGGTAASQIVGALTATGDAGAVEAAILGLGLTTAAATVTNFYVTLDNGTDIGVYRVQATAGADLAINNANEFSVTLITTLTGLNDASLLVAGNFV